jgi:hypothetical protein
VRRDPVTTGAALAGLVGAALAVVLVLGLTLGVDQVDPVQRTISEYGLLAAYAPVFDAGVLAFVAAVLGALVALVRSGILRPRSVGAIGLVLGALGLVAVVVFEKTNWSVGPSVGGYVHRYASLVAFLALPVAAIAAARGHRGAPARWARWLGVASLLWFVPILGAIALGPVTGLPWWQAVPLGLVERGLALTEVLAVVALAWWGARSAAPVPAREFPLTT